MPAMLRTEPYTAPVADCDPPKLAWHAPIVGEFTPEQALADGLITQAEASALTPSHQRLKSHPPNDPLAGMTQKQIWHDCVWISGETAETKLFLLCVGRFFDPDGRSSSMSYAQIRSDCSLSERFVKYGAKSARNRWLKIEIGKGKLTPNGPQNLYHAVCPSELVEELRQRRSKGLAVPYDAKLAAVAGLMPDGVHAMHPNGSGGVHQEHPAGVHGMHGVHATTDRGAPRAHLLTKELSKKEGGAAPKSYRPNGKAEMNAALNPDAAARKAYAQENVTVSQSGKVSIGADFRKALIGEDFTDSQIERGLVKAAPFMDCKPETRMAQVRRGCGWAADEDRKQAAMQRNPGIVRNGRPSL